jgi:putative nucleotidyltransferase with HDIG domain
MRRATTAIVLGFLKRRRAPARAASSPQRPAAGVERAGDEASAPDAAYAEALGIPQDSLYAAWPKLGDEEARTATFLLAHFDAHRPGPASFPALSLRVLDLVRDPDVEVAELARLIELDAALSAGVLVLANSPVFRGVSAIQTVKDAVARLGLSEVAKLASALSARSLYAPEVRAEFEMFGPVWNGLFYHAATVARVAAELARRQGLADPDRVFLAGMLHDVGKSIALRSLAAIVLDDRVTAWEGPALDRILHEVHGKVGAEAHREWRLPASLLAVAERHHEAALEPGRETAAIHAVRLASALRLLPAPGIHPTAPAEAVQSARALGLGPARLRAFRDEVRETEEWVRMLHGDDVGGPAAAR